MNFLMSTISIDYHPLASTDWTFVVVILDWGTKLSGHVRLALSGRANRADECPLLGANRAFDQPLLTNLDL